MDLTWLHVSDFHVRGGDPYDRDVVLRALVGSVGRYRAEGRSPDVIFATGDIAHSGKPQEYEIAEQFFDKLLAAAELECDRLFVIPGNHDVDRDLGVGLARTLDSREQSDTYFRPDLPKPHLTQKLRSYLKWHNRYFTGIRTAAEDSTCGPVELLLANGGRLAILPVNTALFCQDDNDHGKLWVGRRCLERAISDLRKAEGELKIVLVHHPLDWLNPIESGNIQAELEASDVVLLRGHLHETRVESVASAQGEMLRCAAGAAYQTRQWPNRALYGRVHDNWLTIYPIAYVDSPTEIWTTDPSVFPRESGHEKTFPLQRSGSTQAASRAQPTTPPPPPRFRSNIGSRGNRPFVGRDDLIASMVSLLSDTTREGVVVIQGAPGVGKSELAREFARLNRDRYSGGTFLIDASTNAFAIHLASIGQTILDLSFRPDMNLDDRGQQTFAALGVAPVLLVYDNVVSVEHALPWLPFAGMQCHVLLTTLADVATVAWPCVEVKPLSDEQSLELVKKLTGVRFHRGSALHGKPVTASEPPMAGWISRRVYCCTPPRL
jgi:predicted phosphodiesterase